MERSALINKIKTRIDEVCGSGDVIVEIGVENTKPYDSIIDELLDESALEILLKAPFYLLDITEDAELTVVQDKNDKNIGTIELPYDFVRLVSFKMKDWQQPVTSFAMPGDTVAVKQSNKYLRGGTAKPVAVLRKLSTGYIASYYSVKESHEIEEFLYIAKDKVENITDSQAIDAMCWICAGKTLGVLGQHNLANQCYDNAKGLMM